MPIPLGYRGHYTSLEDKPGSGRLLDFDDQALMAAKEEDESLTTRTGCRLQCQSIHGRSSPQKAWKIAGWVPHELSDDNRADCVRIFTKLLQQNKQTPVLKNLVSLGSFLQKRRNKEGLRFPRCFSQRNTETCPQYERYVFSRPGGSLAPDFTRQDQTLLARFRERERERSGHIKTMKFSEGRKSFEMCTNCSSEPVMSSHIFECLGLIKQDLADVPLLVLDLWPR
ncbi:uncharacterized protein TNCV_254361 [Trichonephila clavipes]|nr:uncharacterized protein TNCV_254361 [Trichonephila clavipes]